MKIDCAQRGKYLLIRATGRLDAAWADYFTETVMLQVRNGQHLLVLDAAGMDFLSSAGIRALLQVFKELSRVQGEFRIINPIAFVKQTLNTSGFQMWLEKGVPEDMPVTEDMKARTTAAFSGVQHYMLDEMAVLTASEPLDWIPWQAVDEERVTPLVFTRKTFGLGIGSAAADVDQAREHLGEFLVVAGNVVYQPPDEQVPPDYLIAEKQFLPRMLCIQCLRWTGEMRHLIRFAPADSTPFFPVSDLARLVLDQSGSRAAGFVICGEIEGLVGSALIRSPGVIREEQEINFPEIRNWLTFCGERSFARQQALMAGVVTAGESALTRPCSAAPDLAVHIHAVVFPYQPLPNGKIDSDTITQKLFNGPPPLAVMHLIEDDRPVIGLGESALVRGACWFGPLDNPEVLL